MKRNKFDLSRGKLLTGNQGKMIPINWMEVLPGDTIQQSTTALLRVSPLNAPVMHPVRARIQHYFVPYRKIWEDFEDFITGGEDGTDASTFPTITFGTAPSVSSLADYLGVPLGVNGIEVSALPFRAYAYIWNEMVRNTVLQNELTVDLSSGADSTTNTTLQSVNWEKDRFVGAADDTQLGSEISLPLGTSAPLTGSISDDSAQFHFKNAADTQQYGLRSNNIDDEVTHDNVAGISEQLQYKSGLSLSGVTADLSSATAATVNDLRRAFALQKFAEARQLYGSRYVEYLRYCGVKSSDGRLDRPEYLGGGRQTIQFSEVLSTDGANTGEMSGHGIASMKSNRYRRFFEEHGIVMSFISVLPRTVYSQGLERSWNRRDRTDFFQRELANIGLQEIENKEVYAGHTTPDGVFGYCNQYDEYREGVSTVAGDFHGGQNLDHYHMGRIFASDPALNSGFITADPTDRIYKSTVDDQLYIMTHHSIQARRPIPKSGKPIGVAL